MNIVNDSTPKWYVVHTYSGYESNVEKNLKKIVENRNLSDKILDIKIPVEHVSEVAPTGKNDADGDKVKTKEVERKLYPCYVFVKMAMDDELWHIVRNTTGVTGFVGPGSEPTPLSELEAEKMGVEVKVIELGYKVGDTVRFTSGSVVNKEGVVKEISEDKLEATIVVYSMGGDRPVKIKTTKANVQVISD